MECGANNFLDIISDHIHSLMEHEDYEIGSYDRNIIEWMLDLGANPGEVLKIATIHDSQDILELVLQYSSENLQEIDYNQAMIQATQRNNMNIIELLLNLDQVNVNHANNKGDTALIIATRRGYDNIVRLLFIQYS